MGGHGDSIIDGDNIIVQDGMGGDSDSTGGDDDEGVGGVVLMLIMIIGHGGDGDGVGQGIAISSCVVVMTVVTDDVGGLVVGGMMSMLHPYQTLRSCPFFSHFPPKGFSC